MEKVLKIQSVSDIITNSSSEVFVIKGSGKYEQEVKDFLDEVVELLGYDDDPYCEFDVFTADRDYKDSWYDYSYSRGDLIIASGTDNSIPYLLMQIIEDLGSIPKFRNKIDYSDISRHHLG